MKEIRKKQIEKLVTKLKNISTFEKWFIIFLIAAFLSLITGISVSFYFKAMNLFVSL